MRLLLFGSPCTHWSIAQKNGRETEPSGIGWELFKNCLIAKEKFKPDYFLYENNKSAAQPIKDQIAKEFGVTERSIFGDNGVRMTYINSALVSAQNRQRFYVTNFGDIQQPEDRGILLRDILESGTVPSDRAYCLTHLAGNTRDYFKKHHTNIAFEPVCVAQRGRYSDTGQRGIKTDAPIDQYYEAREDGKTNALTTVSKDNAVAEPIRIGTLPNQNGDVCESQSKRIYSVDGKSVNICSGGGGLGAQTGLYAMNDDGKHRPVYEVLDGKITIKDKQYPIKLRDGYYIIRKLTVKECMRLQTVPDWYEMPCSATQNYKLLGNSWTVEVIVHLLNHIPNIRNEEIEVLSMYDGMSAGQIALKQMGCNVAKYTASEIDKYAIQTTQHNFPGTIQIGDAFQVREERWKV